MNLIIYYFNFDHQGKTATIAHDVNNVPTSSQLPPKKPRNVQFPTAQINAQAPSKVSSIVKNPPRKVQVRSSIPKKVQAPSNVPRSTQGCSRNVQVDSSISRNVHDVPNVPRSTQGNSRNVQVSPSVSRNVLVSPSVSRNVQGSPTVSRSTQGGSPQISTKYDRLLAFFDTSVAKRLATNGK